MNPINGILESEDSLHVMGDMRNFISREINPRIYDLYLYGPIPSKKNEYSTGRGKFFKGPDLKAALDNLEAQVPGDIRDQCFIHPDMEFRFGVNNLRKDRDGMVTTVLDILVRCKVISDDSIKHFNGDILIRSALPTVATGEYLHLRIIPK